MNADAAFVTGKTHRICQDYARAATDGSYVIVADGCSSSQDSDFGARLLVKSIENAIHDPKSVDPLDEMPWTKPPTYPPFNGIAAARAACRTLQLNEMSLDATLLFARYEETKVSSDEITQSGKEFEINKVVKITTFGDGVIAGLRNDGVIVAHHIDFPTGYPQYLNYRLNADRQARLSKMEGNNQPLVNTWLIGKETERVQSVQTPDSENDYNLFIFPISDFKIVALFSDGVETFTDQNMQPIPWQKIVAEMMDIPATKGEFIQRQMNWMVREIAKRKWQHADDFSMGALVL